MSFSSHPIQWIFALGIFLAIVFALSACKVRGGVKRVVLGTVAALCLLLPSYLMVSAFFPHWILAMIFLSFSRSFVLFLGAY